MTDLERLIRELLDAWDEWIDADGWSGPKLDALAATVARLREAVDQSES